VIRQRNSRRAAHPDGGSVGKQDRAYRLIQDRILEGQYAPGVRVVIAALAKELGISPGPVREAVWRLEAEGWLDCRPNACPRVAGAGPTRFRDDGQVLAVLDGFCSALAAPLISERDLAQLGAINAAMFRAFVAGDVAQWHRHDCLFHHLVRRHCPSSPLIARIEEMDRRLRVLPLRSAGDVDCARRAFAQHAEFIAMIALKAPREEIERVAREHWLERVWPLPDQALRGAHAEGSRMEGRRAA
jgi:DNA-binding GntR family transcriptional regulator